MAADIVEVLSYFKLVLLANQNNSLARLLLAPWQLPYIFIYIGPSDFFSFFFLA